MQAAIRPQGRLRGMSRGGARRDDDHGGGKRDDASIHWSLDASFYRRFAGRVETGKHSVSDLAMGLADRF